MDLSIFLNSGLFHWLMLPLLIMLARICDVTIGTLRIIFVSKGKKLLASLLGFFEVLIWLIAIGQIMQNLNNFTSYIGYAFGFAIGNFIGITVEEKLAMGTLVVRIFTNVNPAPLVNSLKAQGFGITTVDGHGSNGPVNVIYSFINRCNLPEVDQMIKKFNPNAFYCVEEVKSVNAGIFPNGKSFFIKNSRVGLMRQIYKRK